MTSAHGQPCQGATEVSAADEAYRRHETLLFGEFSPLDQEEDQDTADIEAWLSGLNEAFVTRLEELGIPATVAAGPGTHTWPYWERGLHEAMPMLLEALGL